MHVSAPRRMVASLAVGAAALTLAACYQQAAYYAAAYAIPPLLLLSVGLLWTRSFAAQLAARGLWWGASLIGAALALGWSTSLSGEAAAVTALGTTTGLLALGFSATVPEGRSLFFAPQAGRATFTMALLLSVCTALSLGYFGVLYSESLYAGGDLATSSDVALLFALAAVSAVSAAGLFTLRVWAWFGAVASTALIGAAAWAGTLPVPAALAGGLAVLGLLAVITQLPLLLQLLRGRGLKPSSRAWAIVPTAVLLSLLGVAAGSLYAP
jgi:hypothetical protein